MRVDHDVLEFKWGRSACKSFALDLLAFCTRFIDNLFGLYGELPPTKFLSSHMPLKVWEASDFAFKGIKKRNALKCVQYYKVSEVQSMYTI